MLPLAERLRPKSLDGFVGQQHLAGEKAVLRRSIESGNIPSMIFWGPPGVGKTTLAVIISKQLQRPFYALSAINSGVKEVREVIEEARKTASTENSKPPILFIDEIHRFSKSQQDSLLGAVEKGIITLIGATTENPSFEVISALLSRCQVYILKPLDNDDLLLLLHKALEEDEFMKGKDIKVLEHEALLRLSGGDARKLLNALELTVNSAETEGLEIRDGGLGNPQFLIPNPQSPIPSIEITDEKVLAAVQQHIALYDKQGEQHYDIISAFIKSMRGSDPNAAVYWLARMFAGGEEPLFIARRMLILASEDIGNANPTALVIANNCFQAVNVIGYPECELILSQTAIYLASSAKSNASYMAIKNAKSKVNETGNLSVPLHIRNAPTKLMKNIGYGSGYEYAHSFKGNFSEQEYLPDAIKETKFFEPGDNDREKELRARLKALWGKKYGY